MPVLTPPELSSEFIRDREPISEPFRPVRRLTALGTEILRQGRNPLICGGINLSSIMPKIPGPDGVEIENPEFSSESCMKLSRPIAEVIVVLSCPQGDLFTYAENPGAFRDAVSNLLADADDVEMIAQLAPVMRAVHGIRGSTIAVVNTDEEASLDPSKKPEPSPSGSPVG